MMLDPRNFICMAVNRSRSSCVKPAMKFVEAEGATRAVCTQHDNSPPINGYYTSVAETLEMIAGGLVDA